MAHPQIAAFARLAEGNAKPTREIAGQKTLITRTIHDMAYNPDRDEIVVPQFYAQAILTFQGGVNGNVAPVRMIFGPDVGLQNPMRVALETVNNELYVPQERSIYVFPLYASGNVAPLRILKGPNTRLTNSSAMVVAVDPMHDLLVVTGGTGGGAQGGSGQILFFNRTDQGNVKPRSVISGPNTKLSGQALFVLYPPRGMILVASRGQNRNHPGNFVGVWSIHDKGDVPPRYTIGGPNGMLRDVRGVTLDVRSKNVIISDKYVNAVLTYHFPEIF